MRWRPKRPQKRKLACKQMKLKKRKTQRGRVRQSGAAVRHCESRKDWRRGKQN